MRIFIPTINRANAQTTLNELPPSIVKKTTLVTSADQYIELKSHYPNVSIRIVPREIKGIAFTRQNILERCDDRYLIMLDDDMKFYMFNEERRMVRSTPIQIVSMFRRLERWLKSGIVHCSITPRFLNWDFKGEYLENTRLMHVLGYDKKVVMSSGCSFIKGVSPANWRFSMDDFHMTLQLLRAGHKNRLCTMSCSDPSPSHHPGGASVYRTPHSQNASAHFLQKMHPGFAKAVERKTKTGWEGMSIRLDARIQWRKAYQSSQGD